MCAAMIAGAHAPQPHAAPLAVELREVSKRYGRRWALVRVSYQLPAGQSLLLTGTNGSGKTTLLRLIATALRPTSGDVRVLGLDGSEERDEVRARVGLLSHASFLYEDLTAEQNLLVLARLLGAESAPPRRPRAPRARGPGQAISPPVPALLRRDAQAPRHRAAAAQGAAA